MEWGYGAPTYSSFPAALGPGGPTYADDVANGSFDNDWGYGDPKPLADVHDSGYGSPYQHLFKSVESTGTLKGKAEFPDNGGEFVVVNGTFDITKQIRVRLVDADGAIHPTVGFCYSGVMGQGDKIKSVDGTSFRFVLPPLLIGVYSVRYYYGETDETGALIEDALRVVFRNRSKEAYAIRRGYPMSYKTGPIDLRSEKAIEVG